MTPPSARTLCATASVVFSALTLQAASYQGSAYDGFSDYAIGNIVGPTLSGGTGWNATGTSDPNLALWGEIRSGNQATVITGTHSFKLLGAASNTLPERQQIVAGLNYPGLLTSDNALQVSGGATGASGTVGRSLGQMVDSGTFYFSYLTQKTTATNRTTSFQLFGVNNADNETIAPVERLSFGQVASNTNILSPITGTVDAGLASQANQGNFALYMSGALTSGSLYKANGIFANDNPVSFAVDTTYLIVGKIEFDVNGVDDRVTMYINPTSLSDESQLTPYMVIDGLNVGKIAGFRVFAGSTASGFDFATAQYDEIRFGSTYSSVLSAIPEPSSFAAMAGLAGLAFAGLRRRRS